ncbi:transposase [Streptomyces sp. NPDC018352]|uniref:transposase n=1 Tax=Streptomyces sp. NPDC018352 TaxID=3157194 RepID=UPI0033F4408D
MVRRALDSALPIALVTADAAYGQEWQLRRMLEEAGVGYVLAVPRSQQVTSPAGSWHMDHVLTGAPAEAWERIFCGNGAKGPRVYDWAAASLPAIDGSDPPTTAGCWPAAAWRVPRRSRITSPSPRQAPPSPLTSQELAGNRYGEVSLGGPATGAESREKLRGEEMHGRGADIRAQLPPKPGTCVHGHARVRAAAVCPGGGVPHSA